MDRHDQAAAAIVYRFAIQHAEKEARLTQAIAEALRNEVREADTRRRPDNALAGDILAEYINSDGRVQNYNDLRSAIVEAMELAAIVAVANHTREAENRAAWDGHDSGRAYQRAQTVHEERDVMKYMTAKYGPRPDAKKETT